MGLGHHPSMHPPCSTIFFSCHFAQCAVPTLQQQGHNSGYGVLSISVMDTCLRNLSKNVKFVAEY